MQIALGLAAFGRIARSIFAMSDGEWDSALAGTAGSAGSAAVLAG